MAWTLAPAPEPPDVSAPPEPDADEWTPIPAPFRAAFADPVTGPPEPGAAEPPRPDLRFCCEWWPPE